VDKTKLPKIQGYFGSPTTLPKIKYLLAANPTKNNLNSQKTVDFP
jgi:hypothetical protein